MKLREFYENFESAVHYLLVNETFLVCLAIRVNFNDLEFLTNF